MPRNVKRDRRYTVIRTTEDEEALVQEFFDATGTDQYYSMSKLASYVDSLTLQELSPKYLTPRRIQITPELDAAIERQRAKTGRPQIRIIIAAIRKFLKEKANDG